MPSSNNYNRGAATFMPSARLNDQGRATPESDAVVSSDEDADLTRSVHSLTGTHQVPPSSQPARRKSFLSEIQSGGLRKMSLTGLPPPSNGSQPTTPSVEHNAWTFGSPLGRVNSNGSNSAWGASASIWNEPRRDSSIRVPGQAATGQGIYSSFSSKTGNFGEETISPISTREMTESTVFPFNIPLHPTPKTYRSQSYSVGQTDLENEVSSVSASGMPLTQSRSRQPGMSNLKHQPVRPSTLREETEPVDTEPFRERDDDEESFGGVRLHSPASLLGHQAINNSLLRQATAAIHENARTFTSTSPHNSTKPQPEKAMQIMDYNKSGADDAVDDEMFDPTLGGRLERRFSEYAEAPRSHLQSSSFATKSQWHTALGFGPLDEMPQSRRHSFAEIPTRRGSLAAPAGSNKQAYGSVAAAYANVTDSPETAQASRQNPHRHTPSEMQASMEQSDMHNRTYAANYFSGVAPALRSQYEAGAPQAASAYSLGGPYRHGPSTAGFNRPGQDCPLYMVAFKCARADAYYVQDGTGLEVNVGDLVIVEADRGHDLGTVTHAKVNWTRARELKEAAADEHYRWLMMFSQYSKTLNSTTVNPNGMLAASKHPGAERAPVEGMGLGMHDAAHLQDMKPKMIKRLAQPHEIATLRDKEGNEAKAKRVCQQKAADHKLNMEILDAEFQM